MNEVARGGVGYPMSPRARVCPRAFACAGARGPSLHATLLATVSATLLATLSAATTSAQHAPPREVDPIRIDVTLRERTLRVLRGDDTLRVMAVSVASGDTLRHGVRRWRFLLPPGPRIVRAKQMEPIWTPPDWHYAEEAAIQHLALRQFPRAGVRLVGGRRVVLRDSVLGVLTDGDPYFNALPLDEHIVFGNVLYIPPLTSRNRRVAGALGRYALDMGDGYLLHGARDAQSIGTATTHGCVQLADDDLAWLFAVVPLGTHVMVRP